MKIAIIILFLSLPFVTFSQVNNENPETDSIYSIHGYTRIKLVSFQAQPDTVNGKIKPRFGLPINHDTICFAKLDQVVSISQSQADTLIDMLYNTCRKLKPLVLSANMCYLPRNAVIFLNEKDRSFEYIEICFECKTLKTSKNKPKPEECDVMYQTLQEYFQSLGLKTKASELMKEIKSSFNNPQFRK